MRKTRYLLLAAVVMGVASLVAPAGAEAFAPALEITTSRTVYDAPSSVTVRLTQGDRQPMIRSHEVALPAGWVLDFRQVRAGSLDTCADAASAIDRSMEAVGLLTIRTQTDATRDPGWRDEDLNSSNVRSSAGEGGSSAAAGEPATYTGTLWFLRWDPARDLARLCGVVSTSNTRTPSEARQLVFDVDIARTSAGWTMAWDYAAADGASPGERALIANPSVTGVTVTETRLILSQRSGGNYNHNRFGEQCARKPKGAMVACSVELSRTPPQPGVYTFTGSFDSCADAACAQQGARVELLRNVNIIEPEHGTHPLPAIVAPERFQLFAARTDVDVSWLPPDAGEHVIKGYELVVAKPDPVPDNTARFHMRYLVTEPSDAAYLADDDPCDATLCSLRLTFPLATQGGQLLQAHDMYALSIVTIFTDGHRSDGRCDDGSLKGSTPPCASGGPPAMTEPGYAFTEFLMRRDPWPMNYREIVQRTDRKGVHRVFLLAVDFDRDRAELIVWQPLVGIEVHDARGPNVTGINGTGGTVGSCCEVSFALSASSVSARGALHDGQAVARINAIRID